MGENRFQWLPDAGNRAVTDAWHVFPLPIQFPGKEAFFISYQLNPLLRPSGWPGAGGCKALKAGRCYPQAFARASTPPVMALAER